MMTAKTLTTEQIKAKWDAAWNRMLDAEAAFQEYVDATDPLYFLETAFLAKHGMSFLHGDVDARNALLAANPAYAVPKHINDHRDALTDKVTNSAADLMATPAPDLAALRWKLDWTADATYVDEYLAQMREDMDRLMGPAPSLDAQIAAAKQVAA